MTEQDAGRPSFDEMMAVVEGRDPITLFMAESRKLDRAGLLDRLEGAAITIKALRDRLAANPLAVAHIGHVLEDDGSCWTCAQMTREVRA